MWLLELVINCTHALHVLGHWLTSLGHCGRSLTTWRLDRSLYQPVLAQPVLREATWNGASSPT